MSLLEALIHLVRFPYEAVKHVQEETRLGRSEEDRKSLHFWKWFAWIGTGLLVGIPLVLWLGWLAFRS